MLNRVMFGVAAGLRIPHMNQDIDYLNDNEWIDNLVWSKQINIRKQASDHVNYRRLINKFKMAIKWVVQWYEDYRHNLFEFLHIHFIWNQLLDQDSLSNLWRFSFIYFDRKHAFKYSNSFPFCFFTLSQLTSLNISHSCIANLANGCKKKHRFPSYSYLCADLAQKNIQDIMIFFHLPPS